MIINFKDNYQYPNLIPKSIRFENIAKRKTLTLKKTGLASGKYAIKDIVLDTGADVTVVPLYLAKKLSLELGEEYNLVYGAFAIGFCKQSRDLLKIEIRQQSHSKISNSVLPTVIVQPLPSVHTEYNHLVGQNEIDESDFEELKLDVNMVDLYSAHVESQRFCKFLSRRLKLAKEHPDLDSSVLLGRDWQQKYLLSFYENSVEIRSR
ncbi:MAG: hypothetical protein ACE5OZ_17565 [Candidatus Heimdallarchaeota archaeon]